MGYVELLDRINRSEAAALGLAVLAIAVAWLGPLPPSDPKVLAGYATVIVVAVLVHELAHRQVARRYGCGARFVLEPRGFLLTLVSAFLPFKILAPGYVGIVCWGFTPYGRGDPELSISAAGPLSNIVLGVAARLAASFAGSYSWLLVNAAVLNGWLAVFNLLPFPPLDGSKVVRRNPGLWAFMMLAAALVMLGA